MSGRGGRRPGAGRPAIDPADSTVRKQRQVRAHDDEWAVIQQFADLVKAGWKNVGKEVVENMKKRIDQVLLEEREMISRHSHGASSDEECSKQLKENAEFLEKNPDRQIELPAGHYAGSGCKSPIINR